MRQLLFRNRFWPEETVRMHKYKILAKKGEGTFSGMHCFLFHNVSVLYFFRTEVIKALCTKTGRLVAIKRMKNVFRSIDQVNNLREIQALKRLSNHPNIIKLYEVLYDRNTGRLALVFELMTCNLYEFAFFLLFLSNPSLLPDIFQSYSRPTAIPP